MTEFPPDRAPRIVKPRTPKHTHRPIIAVTGDELLVERTGQYLPAEALPAVLLSEPSSIIATQGFGAHMNRLIDTFATDATFQYRVTPQYRHSTNLEKRATRIYDAVVNFVGFAQAQPQKGKGGKRVTKYHYPLDPVHFVRTSIDDLHPNDEPTLAKLLKWATEVRSWCEANGLEVRPSAGGLAAQLLRDPRFYPEPRRKAPRRINDAARIQLPGNYYRLHGDRDRRYSALYLDMTNAHHAMARRIKFPNANELHGFGRWTAGAGISNAGSRVLDRFGLFRVRIRVPYIPARLFPPPYMEKPGDVEAWIYSNEFPVINELGGKILGVIAHYSAAEPDEGLNEYAKWAAEEIRRNKSYKPWLKPVLHSSYGILAARPTRFETGHFRAKGGAPGAYPMGKWDVPVKIHKGSGEIDSRIANVIHRGMIEAEVRKESLWLARYLKETGWDIIAIYADSVFVRDNGKPLQFLPPPWRVSEAVTNLRFDDATHFESDQMIRLPGLARSRRQMGRDERLIRREVLIRSAATGRKAPRKSHERGSNASGKAGKQGRRD